MRVNPRLEMTVGVKVGEEFEVPPAEEGAFLVGRDTLCDLRLADTQLSRRHCRFTFEGGFVYLQDLKSKNGTRVNGKRARRRVHLRHGDRIQIGSTELRVKYATSEESVRRTDKDAADALSPVRQLARRIASLEEENFAGLHLDVRIWEGEDSCTFRAHDPASDQPVALKFLKPDVGGTAEQKTRFLRGAKEAAGLDQPHLIKVLRSGTYEEIAYTVMEYVEGSNLQRLLTKAGVPMKPHGAVAICRQMLSALQHIYEKGLVLRSVQPDNVIVVPGFGAKLADYDLLKHLPGEHEKQVTSILDDDIVVDPQFAAPELIARPFLADQRADVFGAGATLYYMLTLSAPFPATLPADRPAHAFKRELPDPGSINPKAPAAISDVIRKAMAGYVDKRYQTPKEMATALNEATKGL